MSLRREMTGLAWVSPWIIGGAVFLFLPIGMSLYYAFTDYSMLEPPLWVGLENFRALGDDPRFWLTVRNTVIYAAIAVPMTTVVAVLLAVLVNRPTRIGRLAQSAVFLPSLVPLVASAMVWLWLFNGENGLINRVLGFAWIDGPNWLIEPGWAIPALVIMSLWGIGQSVVIYVAALQDVPAQLHEAAMIDGMGALRRLWHITLPMISPVVLFNVIVTTINAVQIFAVPFIMFRTVAGQNDAGYFFTMYMYDNAFQYGKMGYASALAWVQLLVILVLTGLMLLAGKRLVYYRAG